MCHSGAALVFRGWCNAHGGTAVTRVGDSDAIWHPSPNFGARRGGLSPALVVLHYTAMADYSGALRALCDPIREVSAHYLIDRDGCVIQLVDEAKRAWHAGIGTWYGADDVNSRSIGIEMVNTGAEPFSEPLMRALEALLCGVLSRWDIPPEGVIGHSDMAPGRKIDPGPRFDWLRLERQGLARARGIAAPSGDRRPFREVARSVGYSAEVSDETLLAAVRLRYRPWATGPLSPEDFAVLGPC